MLFTELAIMLAKQNGAQITHQESQGKQSFWRELLSGWDRPQRALPAAVK